MKNPLQCCVWINVMVSPASLPSNTHSNTVCPLALIAIVHFTYIKQTEMMLWKYMVGFFNHFISRPMDCTKHIFPVTLSI